MSHTINFLQESKEISQKKKKRTTFFSSHLLLAIAILFFVFIGWTLFFALQATHEVFEGKNHFMEAKHALQKGDILAMQNSFVQAQESLEHAHRSFERVAYLSFIPGIRDSFFEAREFIMSGKMIADALSDLVDIFVDLWQLADLGENQVNDLFSKMDLQQTLSSLSPETKGLLLKRLQGASPELVRISLAMQIAQERLAYLSKQKYFSVFDELFGKITQDLDVLQEGLNLLVPVSRFLPLFAGVDTPHTTLLLFLNNDELRPGGGFIGSYGIGEMALGELTMLKTMDSYALDNAALPYLQTIPPEPLANYNESKAWFFRDSNWSPDFAVSAKQAIELFAKEQEVVPQEQRTDLQEPVTIEAVIGFTPTFVSDVLRLTGPVTLQDGQSVSADNVADVIEYEVEKGFVFDGLAYDKRKQVLSYLVEEIRKRLFSLPISLSKEFIAIVQKNIQEKQLVFYHADTLVQDALTQEGYAGRLFAKPTDTIAMIDANLASLKSDPLVNRPTTYRIHKEQEGWVGTLTRTYEHRGSFDWKTTRYRTYIRAYVPLGSQLLSFSGFLENDLVKNPEQRPGKIDITQELGMSVFGGFTSVEPGKTQTISFSFLLAPNIQALIEQGTYDLHFFKQIGVRSYPLTLQLDFDKDVKRAFPAEEEKEWDD